MLTLDLPVEPYWLDLPRGVRVEIRPVTTAVMAAAQAASARRLSAQRAAEPDLDPDMARGLAFAFLVKALARHAILAWEGIGDTSGKPLPLSPDAVERLMDLDDIAAAFWDRATSPVAAARPSRAIATIAALTRNTHRSASRLMPAGPPARPVLRPAWPALRSTSPMHLPPRVISARRAGPLRKC